MYIVGISDEDFLESEAQVKGVKKQSVTNVREASLNVNPPYASGALKNIYMFKDVSMASGQAGSPIAEEIAAVTA